MKWTFKKKVMFVLYWAFAAWLPSSSHCRLGKALRGFFARRILASCGKNVNIERFAYFTPEVSLGDGSGIGIRAEIHGNVKIGSKVMMGPEVICYTLNHRHDRLDIPMGDQGHEEPKGIEIGDDVWLGRRVMIMPGVHIGNGVIIGAGGVVAKDIPPYSVACGVPAKVVKMRGESEEEVSIGSRQSDGSIHV